MPPDSAYQPLGPARRPGGKPEQAPLYRVLVHRRYSRHWDEMVTRVGLQQAEQLWDHLAHNPGRPPAIGSTCYLRGKAGKPQGDGWSRTVHYELSSMARVDFQFHDKFDQGADGDEHPVVAILTINYSSH
ncbi:hypothetical protein [Amycolatopsis thailandensis]|uniref:hypothetical protein n=1 Tax=Amycolatopsis thailandensis TaxID=589330 RepID=UPI0036426FB6